MQREIKFSLHDYNIKNTTEDVIHTFKQLNKRRRSVITKPRKSNIMIITGMSRYERKTMSYLQDELYKRFSKRGVNPNQIKK